MADAPPIAAPGRLAKIALALAVLAVVLVGAMTVVVATRRTHRPRAKVVVTDAPKVEAISSLRVSAHDVVRIDRTTVDAVTDPRGPVGIKINDADLRDALKLDPTDVIVAISGKAVRRQFDVYDALLGASMMNASSLFVELLRAGKPRLVKWELDGDLREARTGVASRPAPVPPVALAPDPLARAVTKIDDRVFTLPRSAFEELGSKVLAGGSSGILAASAYRGGSVEGLKLFAIRPGSIWQKLELENGDVITTVNGRGISVTSLRDDYEVLRKTSVLEVEMLRNGAAMHLKVSITQ